MKGKYIKKFFLLAVILLMVFLYRSCAPFWGYEREVVYTSPEGTNTIAVKYTVVSTPAVFKKGRFWDEKIWTYPGNGFQETVSFDVTWLSESQIRLRYDDNDDQFDEEFIIVIPE